MNKKKILAVLMILVILINILPSTSFGSGVFENTGPVNAIDIYQSYGLNEFNSYEEYGTANYAGNQVLVTGTESSGASHATILSGIFTFIPYCMSCLMTAAIHSGTNPGEYSTTPDRNIYS